MGALRAVGVMELLTVLGLCDTSKSHCHLPEVRLVSVCESTDSTPLCRLFSLTKVCRVHRCASHSKSEHDLGTRSPGDWHQREAFAVTRAPEHDT